MPDQQCSVNEIIEGARDCLRNVNAKLTLDSDGSLDQMGLDSMEAVNFFLELESRFNVDITPEDIEREDLNDVRKLVHYLVARSNQDIK